VQSNSSAAHERLLAFAEKNAAGDLPATVEARQLVLEDAARSIQRYARK